MSTLMSRKVTRRALFRWLGLASLASLAAGCEGGAQSVFFFEEITASPGEREGTREPPTLPALRRTPTVDLRCTEMGEVRRVSEKPPRPAAALGPNVAGGELSADQTLRLAVPLLGRVDPANGWPDDAAYLEHIFMPLFRRDRRGDLQPWLALRAEKNPQMTVYRVYLDSRAVWSDGSPVLAQEAKDYWLWACLPTCGGCTVPAVSGLDVIQGVTDFMEGGARDIPGIVVRDHWTIEFHLTQRDPLFLDRLASWPAGFAKVQDLQRGGGGWAARVNGPFMPQGWDVENRRGELAPNPRWWGARNPLLRRVALESVEDQDAALSKWRQSEIDIAAPAFTGLCAVLRQAEPERLLPVPCPTARYLMLSSKLPPLDDIRVRKALAHAVDWEQAVATACGNPQRGACPERSAGVLPPEMRGSAAHYWPEWGYDPARARRELARSRYGGPDKLPRILLAAGSDRPLYRRAAEAALRQWQANLGIRDVELKPGPPAAFGPEQGQVQIRGASLGATPTLSDAAAFLSSFRDAELDPALPQGMADPAAYARVDQALRRLSAMDRDDPAYPAEAARVEALVLGEYLFLPLAWDRAEYAVQPWIRGIDAGPAGGLALLDAYVARR